MGLVVFKGPPDTHTHTHVQRSTHPWLVGGLKCSTTTVPV